ncbi:MAG TPA: hypothetical protein VMY78_11050 [Solirubrobacteraceae bacterium]|nr:hypothetical protein [Solirubrobacteraceae bacterium]
MPTVSSPAPYSPHDDEDFSYVWSAGSLEIPIPRWLAEIMEVYVWVRLELLLIGFCAGLIVAMVAVLIGFSAA